LVGFQVQGSRFKVLVQGSRTPNQHPEPGTLNPEP
jgi:hypothetical protein